MTSRLDPLSDSFVNQLRQFSGLELKEYAPDWLKEMKAKSWRGVELGSPWAKSFEAWLEVLKEKELLNEPIFSGHTLLTAAAQGGYFEVVHQLVQGGANINAPTSAELGLKSMLMVAVKVNRYSAQFLEDSWKDGADFDQVDDRQKNILHYITERKEAGRKDIVLICSKMTNINARDQDDIIPLHLALANQNYEVALELLDQGADYFAQSSASAFVKNGSLIDFLTADGDIESQESMIESLKKYCPQKYDQYQLIKEKVLAAQEKKALMVAVNMSCSKIVCANQSAPPTKPRHSL